MVEKDVNVSVVRVLKMVVDGQLPEHSVKPTICALLVQSPWDPRVCLIAPIVCAKGISFGPH